MTMQQIVASQANAEVPVNENFQTLEHQSVYGKRHPVTTGLTWGYYGGRWSGLSVADGTLTLTANQTNYLVVNRSTGAITTSTTSTNWDNTTTYARVYKIITGASTVTSLEDHRAGANGVNGFIQAASAMSQLSDIDFDPVPTDGQLLKYNGTTSKWEPYTLSTGTVTQNSQSANYTLVLGDAGKHILHPSADTTARTFTIPANSSVAFPVGTVITFVNQNAAGSVTIEITTDTMRLAGAGTTGSRTLAANGIATAMKITSTEWIISGAGLT